MAFGDPPIFFFGQFLNRIRALNRSKCSGPPPGSLLGLGLVLAACLGSSGCTVANPDVKKLFTSLSPFTLGSSSLRIPELSLLDSIQIQASCNPGNTGFEYQMPGNSQWTSLPSVASAPFVSVTNDCARSGRLMMTLDLSQTSPFKDMQLGESQILRFRDSNSFSSSTEQEFRITYSKLNLFDQRVVFGQGYNNARYGSQHTLQGRVISIGLLNSIQGLNSDGSPGPHQLEGRIVDP
jgi:hypothetical protein